MKIWLALTLFFLSLAARGAAPSLDLNVALDPDTHHLRVRAVVTPASRDFRFFLHESLKIANASSGGKSLVPVLTNQNGPIRGWRIVLPVKTEKLVLEYGGTLPALDRDLDHRSVLQGLSPMTSTEGSFLPSGGAWYPQPAPLFSYRVSLSVPADQRALVPGRLTAEKIPSDTGRYQATFEFLFPADGIDLMAGPWRIRERMMPRENGAPIRLRTYFFPDLDAIPGLTDSYLDDTHRYLAMYGREIGPYPFTEFSVVASPLPTGFGMPTLTYLGADVLRLPFIRATSLGHEVLHNWWGNGVYVDYASGNWCEGLTTFMADYAYKEKDSPEAAREMRLGWLRDFAAVPAEHQQSLASFRSRTHGAAAAVGYGKSAMVFLMLRDAIGENAFQQGLRTFWDTFRFRVATWKDLQKNFEEASGRPLDYFFDEWINRAGGPKITISQAKATPSGDPPRLTLAVEQSSPAYALHMPVEISYPGKSDVRWIDISRERELVSLDVDGKPDGARLDPDLRIWRRLDAKQLPPILRQWVIASSPRLLLTSDSADFTQIGQALSGRLFENPPKAIAPDGIDQSPDPVLLIGLTSDIDATLAKAGLPPRPASLATRGTAQVWTIFREGKTPVAVISAQDAISLRALLRPLPHYGSQSWLTFEGSKVTGKGVWSAPGRLVPIQYGPSSEGGN